MSNDPVQWKENLPPELADAPYFKNAENVAQVRADLDNAAKLQGNLGDTHLRTPPPDAADADKQAWRERVQVIDPSLVVKPEDYSPVPEEYKAPEAFEGDFDAIAAEAKTLGLTEAQFTQLMANVGEKTAAATEAQAQWRAEQDKIIDAKLGDARADHLSRSIAKVMDINPALAQQMTEGSLDAGVLLTINQLVTDMAAMGGEQGQFNEQAGAEGRGLTPDEIDSKSFELRVEMKNMHPGTPQYERKMTQLLEYQALAMQHR